MLPQCLKPHLQGVCLPGSFQVMELEDSGSRGHWRPNNPHYAQSALCHGGPLLLGEPDWKDGPISFARMNKHKTNKTVLRVMKLQGRRIHVP